MATDSAVAQAIVALFTPTPTQNPKSAALMQAEADAVSAMSTIANTALAGIPALDFPVEKDIVDGVAKLVITILVDQADNGIFDAIASVSTKNKIAATQAAQQADQSNPSQANQDTFESDAGNSISFIGSTKK